MSTLVYKYGIHAPHEGADLVHEQMSLAQRYRNARVEIERGRRAAIRALEATVGDVPGALAAISTATEAREEAWRAVARHRARTHKRDEPQALVTALARARDVERDAKATFRDLREALKDDVAHPAVFLGRAEIDQRARELAANAYEHSGCYWGQRALVDEAAARSFADLALYDGAEPQDPRFSRSRGDGAVGLQIMGGLTVAELHGCEDTRLRLRPPDARAWQGAPPRAGGPIRIAKGTIPGARVPDDQASKTTMKRRYASTAELSLRIGSDGRAPVWARWVVDMDRPLPDGVRVTWATVHLRQVGPHSRWSCELTLDIPADARAGHTATTGGAVAIDVGWRQEGDELRVATWLDEHGASGYLRLDKATLALLRSPDAIQGERDDRFSGARLGLAWWLAHYDAPDGLRAELRTMRQWHSPARLERVWRLWSERRFDGDERVYSALTAWRWHDRSLWSAAEKNRGQSLRRRREVYRVFAAQLATRYDVVVVEAFDKRRVARRSDKTENETARANRQLAATSELCVALEQAAKSRGRSHAALSAHDTTRICPACGLVGDRDAARSIMLVCECGNVWDQDVGAGEVLLVRWRERLRAGETAGTARVVKKKNKDARDGESKWQRAARKRTERGAKIRTAREALGMPVE